MLTKSRIDRAGVRLRKADTPFDADRELYSEYRATFAVPLTAVVAVLNNLAAGAPVTYRLKRFETTVDKLRRFKSRLSSIEDIAGCRVVLPTRREQHQLLDGIRDDLQIVRERDYQARPRGGYRAVHAVVRVQGQLVEIQLRTELEEQWADSVERLAEKHDPLIKYSGGPPSVLEVLSLISDVFKEFDESKVVRHRILRRLPSVLESVAGDPSLAEAMSLVVARLRRDLDAEGVSLDGSAIGNLQKAMDYDIAVAEDPKVLPTLKAYLESVSGLHQSLVTLDESLEVFAGQEAR
ncbi:MAG: RelA/SpoT domain-containing protein [Chloroflexi bacterium]|nr:RelA/SpoT domain-containing protein [Chloroflexota bacterium]